MAEDRTRRWLLTKQERGNRSTLLDVRHPGDQAWSSGNAATALVHGSTYFAELHRCLEATASGDLVMFTDWQGNADEQLLGEPGSEALAVLGRALDRGVDVRGLIWRSHWEGLNFSARQNRTLGQELQDRGAEIQLDMRVRTGGAHHQKFVVIRHRQRPEDDVAFVGGVDLCHGRRDDERHLGDPQADEMAPEYGETPPWHDVQVALRGPVVHDVETVFRERWADSTPLTMNPLRWVQDRVKGLPADPEPLPPQAPPPPPVEDGHQTVQLLRTYPRLGFGRGHDFAPDGERSVARGYTKALSCAQHLVYVEDQYLWGREMAEVFAEALQRSPDLHVVAVIPLVPEESGLLVEKPQQLGRLRALQRLGEVAPGRVAVYGIENGHGTPVYVHAKVCVVDDVWATVGSDNFNRRSWTHDSELTAAVLDDRPGPEGFARNLRLTLAAEHLDRSRADLEECLPGGAALRQTSRTFFRAFADSAERLDGWHRSGRAGERPPGRLRALPVPRLSRPAQALAAVPYRLLHDPDGRRIPERLRHEL